MKIKAFFQEKQKELAHQKKLLKRKAFVFKIKVFFLGVLPAVIILLAAKTLETLLRIKLREVVSTQPVADSSQESSPAPIIKPVSQTFSKPEFVTPVPVSKPVSDDSQRET